MSRLKWIPDLHSIADDRARQLVRQLLNLREDVGSLVISGVRNYLIF